MVTAAGAMVLSYALAAQTLDVNIESTANGAHVELLRDQGHCTTSRHE
jgi:hypothetical protein